MTTNRTSPNTSFVASLIIHNRTFPRIWICLALLLVCLGTTTVQAQRDALQVGGVYLEQPIERSNDNIWFPTASGSDDSFYLLYQHITYTGDEEGTIRIKGRQFYNGIWQTEFDVGNPVSFQRRSPPLIYSMIIDTSNTLYVATTESADQLSIIRATTNNQTITPPRGRQVSKISAKNSSVAPRIFSRGDAGLIVFFNRVMDNVQTIFYSVSRNGIQWTDPAILDADPDIGFSFLPYYTRTDNREYVVFQGLNTARSNGYQLYFKSRDIGTQSWTPR